MAGSGKYNREAMSSRGASVKAALIAAPFALVLGLMFAVPVWFVLAFFSRLITGRIHAMAFVIAGAGGLVFLAWIFRLVFDYLRKGFSRQARA